MLTPKLGEDQTPSFEPVDLEQVILTSEQQDVGSDSDHEKLPRKRGWGVAKGYEMPRNLVDQTWIHTDEQGRLPHGMLPDKVHSAISL
ncbi:hypothetical protein SLEP1_g33814 [Rubroshorea leprosula]|uniref:Uncharacterized protein n=1 Tax=Rubroshorea leprosula TaxID=152421 RepID=A0AAV5KHX3_9ROSI|nr:hypothetical protein SLEP1_g33814 [Rubroshorea leprosula]